MAWQSSAPEDWLAAGWVVQTSSGVPWHSSSAEVAPEAAQQPSTAAGSADASQQPVPVQQQQPQVQAVVVHAPPEAVGWPGRWPEDQLDRWAGRLVSAIRHTGAPPSAAHPNNGTRQDNAPFGSPMGFQCLAEALRKEVPEEAVPHCILYSHRLSWVMVETPGLVTWKVSATRPRREGRRRGR